MVCAIGKLLLTTFKKFMHDKKRKTQTVFSLDDMSWLIFVVVNVFISLIDESRDKDNCQKAHRLH